MSQLQLQSCLRNLSFYHLHITYCLTAVRALREHAMLLVLLRSVVQVFMSVVPRKANLISWCSCMTLMSFVFYHKHVNNVLYIKHVDAYLDGFADILETSSDNRQKPIETTHLLYQNCIHALLVWCWVFPQSHFCIKVLWQLAQDICGHFIDHFICRLGSSWRCFGLFKCRCDLLGQWQVGFCCDHNCTSCSLLELEFPKEHLKSLIFLHIIDFST